MAKQETEALEPRGGSPFVPERAPNAALVESDVQRQVAEVQAAMVIAKRFPRDEEKALRRLVEACKDLKLAEKALYSYRRGGTEVEGETVRLAEAAARCYENLDFGIREIEQRDGVSTMQAYAWDMENNIRETRVFQVEHKRYTRKGSYAVEDPRDVYEMVTSSGSRRKRACIISVVPTHIMEAAKAQCLETLRESVDMSPEGIEKVVGLFEDYFGVPREALEKVIQRHIGKAKPIHIVRLKTIYNSLVDGMSSPEDWFEMPRGAKPKKQGTEGLEEMLKREGAGSEKV